MSKYIIDWGAQTKAKDYMIWTQTPDFEDFIEKTPSTDKQDEVVIQEMKALAARLSLAIDFNYMTISWSEGLNSPIVQLWYHKPVWKTGIDDYGQDYACWSGQDNWSGWGVIDSRAVRHSQVLATLPQETDFSKFMIKRAMKNG